METMCNAKMTAATPALSRTPKIVSSAKAPKTVIVAGILWRVIKRLTYSTAEAADTTAVAV